MTATRGDEELLAPTSAPRSRTAAPRPCGRPTSHHARKILALRERTDLQVAGGVLAYHFREAGLPARAIDHSLRAGDSAARSFLFGEALVNYAAAEALAGTAPSPTSPSVVRPRSGASRSSATPPRWRNGFERVAEAAGWPTGGTGWPARWPGERRSRPCGRNFADFAADSCGRSWAPSAKAPHRHGQLGLREQRTG